MGGGRKGLRGGACLAADGGRSVHHFRVFGRQRLGLLARRARPLHPRLYLAGLRAVVLLSASALGSGAGLPAANGIGFLRKAVRQQTSGRLRGTPQRRFHRSLRGPAAHRPGHHRPGGEFRNHRPDLGDGHRGCGGGRVRAGQRHPRRGVVQRAQGPAASRRRYFHWPGRAVLLFPWHSAAVSSLWRRLTPTTW